GKLTVNAVHGRATFSDLTIDKPGSGFTLAVSAPGLNGTSTVPFSVAVPTAPIFTSVGDASIQAGKSGLVNVTAHSGNSSAVKLTEAGVLPTGLRFSAGKTGTATISGTPSRGSGGVYHLIITADNGTRVTQDF